MKKIIAFLFPDWKPVWASKAIWNINNDLYSSRQECHYEILFSERRNDFKLICNGYDPKSHQYYGNVVIPKYNELRLKLIKQNI